MDNELTSCVLLYLLENSFDSKADMARQFDMDERYIQRLIKNVENTKGATLALQKALAYCIEKHIPIGNILDALAEAEDEPTISERAAHGRLAYMNLRVMRPENMTPEGVEVYESMLLFVRKASVKVCPYCKTWCNPWHGRFYVNEQKCYIGHIANEICRSVTQLYTRAGDET